jgi:hypothetical protein
MIFKSTRKFKKYMAVFAGSKKVVHFGDNRYGQYKDKTKLKLYLRIKAVVIFAVVFFCLFFCLQVPVDCIAPNGT